MLSENKACTCTSVGVVGNWEHFHVEVEAWCVNTLTSNHFVGIRAGPPTPQPTKFQGQQ